jgi:hypothetical protein
MSGIDSIWRFTLCSLALWRVTHLLAEEDGPWDAIVQLRVALGSSIFGRLMDCFYCLSLWLSIPLAIWLSRAWVELPVLWLALSGVAGLLERATQKAGLTPPQALPEAQIHSGDVSCAVAKSEMQ